jgi:hypothetical protein
VVEVVEVVAVLDPPKAPEAALVTVTDALPAAAMSASLIWAMSSVVEM